MGAFAVVRKNPAPSEVLAESQILDTFHRQGFASSTKIGTKHWDIFLFGKYSGVPPTILTLDQDNFIACSGTFLYKGTAGTVGLRNMFERFRNSSIEWDCVQGSFCILLMCDEALHLLADRLGVYKVYSTTTDTIISSSFLGILEIINQRSAATQSIYEYVFQGATLGDRTVINEIKTIKPGSLLHLSDKISVTRQPSDLWKGQRWRSFGDQLEHVHARLKTNMRWLIDAFGGNIDTALSGGYDSRLLLALLKEHGVRPRIHVYGDDNDGDVVIGKAVAAAEGFEITHTNKSRFRKPDIGEFAEIISQNFFLFDGYPSDGIFDSGADAATRRERAFSGALALNGGGGEIFRNFFYLRDRRMSIRNVLWSFFFQFDPAVCTSRFIEREYLTKMSAAVADILGYEDAEAPWRIEISRAEVEYLYPCLRCAYWMGRNNSINNRFGYAGTPFVESSIVKLALRIPIEFKNFGRFESALVRKADLTLAGYPSIYGHDFITDPTIGRMARDYMTILRPAFMRKLSYRLRSRFYHRSTDYALSEEYLNSAIDAALPEMRRYFNVERVRSASELNRICTLEYLFERYRTAHV